MRLKSDERELNEKLLLHSPHFSKRKWQISSTLIWQPIRQACVQGRGRRGSYMCDISHDILRVVFSKSFLRISLATKLNKTT